MPKKETPEEKRARYLAMVDQGAQEFRQLSTPAPDPTPSPAPRPVEPPPPPPASPATRSALDDTPPEDPGEVPPSVPEEYFLKEPMPSSKGLRERGWKEGTSLYDPTVKRKAMELAGTLGLSFAELQNLALGLVLDPKKRSTETDALLARVKSRFQ